MTCPSCGYPHPARIAESCGYCEVYPEVREPMKLIEAFIIAQQEYGIYGDWKATHSSGCYIGRGPHGSMYFAFDLNLISQSERLETVLANFAEKYPYETLDEHWKVSRWDEGDHHEQ